MEMGPTQQYGPWILLIYIYIKLRLIQKYALIRLHRGGEGGGGGERGGGVNIHKKLSSEHIFQIF
jgi:hypothetical protein